MADSLLARAKAVAASREVDDAFAVRRRGGGGAVCEA